MDINQYTKQLGLAYEIIEPLKDIKRLFTDETIKYHSLEVAQMVEHYTDDLEMHVAAILHDSLEDIEGLTVNDLIGKFNPRVVRMVQDLTNNPKLESEIGRTKMITRKFMNMPEDSLIIKLCDRLHNVSSLGDLYLLPDYERRSSQAVVQKVDRFVRTYACETQLIISMLESHWFKLSKLNHHGWAFERLVEKIKDELLELRY